MELTPALQLAVMAVLEAVLRSQLELLELEQLVKETTVAQPQLTQQAQVAVELAVSALQQLQHPVVLTVEMVDQELALIKHGITQLKLG